MKKPLFLLLFACFSLSVFSQQTPNLPAGSSNGSSEKAEKPPIDLYKIVSATRDTTYIDTTLSIQKEYKFNYLRRDDFELMPFNNVGHTYNSLGYNFDKTNLKPLFVAQSHHFNYYEIEDINYFNVPTPLTELYFKTAFEQGQQLDAFFTINTSERFNFSLAYKGVRSLGNYQHNLASTGNFTFTTNYNTKNNKYRIKAHLAAQDVLNRENGGLDDESLLLFINDDSQFSDRGRLEVLFEDGENKLEGLRFYVDHEYELIGVKDSINFTSLYVGNITSYEDKNYEYRQLTPYEGFGEAYETANLSEKVKLEDFNVKGYARFNNNIFGKLSAFIGYTDYNYGYDSVLILNDGRIPNRLKGNIVETGASYEKQYRGFKLFGKGAINVSGDFDGNYLKAGASFALNEDNKVEGSISVHSVAPNFNFLLYQSDYVNYNWSSNFNNVKTQELRLDLTSKKFLNASVSYTGIDDYTYFAIEGDDLTPTPQQYGERVDYLKIKAEKEFTYKRFALMNTVMYQQVVSGDAVFNVPQVVTRNSLYYQDHWFKRALFLQTGVNFKYFTKYNMNAYDPVLAEFYVQNEQELGGFPMLDLFFNAKVKQTRIFIKWEHFNTLFSSKNEYFSAPGHPYRDAVIRFGLVWDFFL